MFAVSTVDPIEVVWMVISLLGTFFTIFLLRDARSDLQAIITRAINSAALVKARSDYRQEKWRLSGQIILDLVGVLALTRSPSPEAVRSGTTWITIILFILFNLILVAMSYDSWRTRKTILRIFGGDTSSDRTTRTSRFSSFQKRRRKAFDASEKVEAEEFEAEENDRS